MTEQEKPDDAGALGCGRQLRRTREKLGLSVDDVADELRLSGFQIQALEDDDWEQLPGTTYARGYLRSYARLIGLDGDQLMAGASTQEIELSRKEPEIQAGASAARESDAQPLAPGSSGASPWRWLGVLGVVAVLAAGYWQYREGWELIPNGAGPGDGAQYGEGAGQEAGRAAAMRDEVTAAAPAPGTEAATDARDDAADDDAPPMPDIPGRAVFQFEARSWIDVRDATGERLLYRSFPPGRRIQVQGRPPFHVYLGNARAVRVEYMGEVIAPNAAPERLYARLVLGAPSG